MKDKLPRYKGKDFNIILCNDRLIVKLNRQFKAKNNPTDVLAFNFNNPPGKGLFGEIYIDLQQAKRQAKKYNIEFDEEVTRLTFHGILHLLGYRDDNAKNRKKMWKIQEEYLANGYRRR